MGQGLSHDVALVTGAERGIGRAIALSLAAGGTAVAVCARTEFEIVETAALARRSRRTVAERSRSRST